MTEEALNQKYLKLRIYCTEILKHYDRGEYDIVDKKYRRLKSSIEQNLISIWFSLKITFKFWNVHFNSFTKVNIT